MSLALRRNVSSATWPIRTISIGWRATLAARRIDILANVAGLQYFGPIERQGADRLRLGYAVNLVAPAALAAAVVPQMVARGDGQIVNIGSMMGAVPYPYFTTYSSAKAGLKAFSQALRRELHGRGVDGDPHRAARGPHRVQHARDRALHGGDQDERGSRPNGSPRGSSRAIERREHDVSIGLAERFYSQLNAALPGMIDRGLSGQIATARALFTH